MQKDLMRAVKPALSCTEKLPPTQDLQTYWERVERAVCGLDDEIHVQRLVRLHLMQIGAIILGDSVWEVVKNGHFQDWGEFKLEVEGRFGLTQHQLLDDFYAMRPIVGESITQFILHVEDKRVRYKVDPPNCYHTFVQFLDETE